MAKHQKIKIMYTTNAIESLNKSYIRINKGRRIFPSETSLEKSLYLATEIITEKSVNKVSKHCIMSSVFSARLIK